MVALCHREVGDPRFLFEPLSLEYLSFRIITLPKKTYDTLIITGFRKDTHFF
jgi:hypothetical protein